MALSIVDYGGVVGFGYDRSTGERGMIIKQVNGTGITSVKGTVLSCSTTEDNKVVLQSNEYDAHSVCAESGVSPNSEMWCWTTGSDCQVLVKDGVTVTRAGIMIAADTDGRADWIQNPGLGLPGTDTHFKEIGHPKESKTSGTDVLCLIRFHTL